VRKGPFYQVVKDGLIEATGDVILSKSAVSNITEALYEDFEEFQSRDLSCFDVEYLFLDAIYESLGMRFNVKEAVLCAWGITRDGYKVLLHLGGGNKESYRDWLEFLRDMVKRNLNTPTTVTTDGAPGLIKAVEAVFPKILRIRCLYHRMQNLASKVSEILWPDIKAEIAAIRDASNYEQGYRLGFEFIQKYEDEFPSLVKAFKEDLDGLLNHLKLPPRHRRYAFDYEPHRKKFRGRKKEDEGHTGFYDGKVGFKACLFSACKGSCQME